MINYIYSVTIFIISIYKKHEKVIFVLKLKFSQVTTKFESIDSSESKQQNCIN